MIDHFESFESRLRKVQWGKFTGPELYNPDELINWILKLAYLRNQKSRDKAYENRVYNGVLSSVGNNHRGTYYPAILAALGFIQEVHFSSNGNFATDVAKEILIDLQWSFCAELGSYKLHTASEIESFVQKDRIDIQP